MSTEELRILRAARAGRLGTNVHGRYEIDGEGRPERRVREVLMRKDFLTSPHWRTGRVSITSEGEAALRLEVAS